jgi:hypothetical protein
MLFFDIGGGLPAGMETEAILGSLLMHSIHEALRRMSKMPKWHGPTRAYGAGLCLGAV